jgi:hypothetical protein
MPHPAVTAQGTVLRTGSSAGIHHAPMRLPGAGFGDSLPAAYQLLLASHMRRQVRWQLLLRLSAIASVPSVWACEVVRREAAALKLDPGLGGGGCMSTGGDALSC